MVALELLLLKLQATRSQQIYLAPFTILTGHCFMNLVLSFSKKLRSLTAQSGGDENS